jgi:hypothetical protein
MMDDTGILRLLALALWVPMLAVFVMRCRRMLARGQQLALDFSLAMYTLTFYAGVCALFVGRNFLVDAYFNGVLSPPSRTPFGALLLIASLPYFVLPVLLALLHRIWPPGKLREIAPAAAPRASIGPLACVVGVTLALLPVAWMNRDLFPTLLANSLALDDTSGLVELYAKRRELFESLSAMQAGMLYGTLPAAAALLLFGPPSPFGIVRVLGLALAVLAVLVNVGLFQIGPVLAFGLMLLLCALFRWQSCIRWPQLVAFGLCGLLVFGAYESLKSRDDGGAMPALQILLRMPIALPFLWQFHDESPRDVVRSDSLPHDLGEFMFPELRGPERFVAMPQPGFIEAYFQEGLSLSLIVLAVTALIAFIGGQALDHCRHRGDQLRGSFVAIVLAPALYYAFQVGVIDAVISSYGVLWVALPPAMVQFVHAFFSLSTKVRMNVIQASEP